MSKERTLKMSEIFTETQIERVTDFLESKDARGLQEYLRSIRNDLERKGILPEYMFCVLCNNFKLKP